MKRIAFPFFIFLFSTTAPAAESVQGNTTPPFRFAEATIEQLQTQMQTGALTSHALTAAYLQRITEIDRAGPTLRSVIEINPEALAMADALDKERAAGKVRGPLHGIPVLIKDNIATADRMETTAGSLALVGARPKHDATIITRLRGAGAVILGKTNLSEWANYRGDRSISGWSARGGQTRNPYALDRNPSGSSSGSAVAVAANLCVVAVGTETNGSIISPATHCGVVGIKPTVGLLSRSGIIPISVTQDTAGPFARTVRDAAVLLGALAGPDPADAATRARPSDLRTDFPAALKRDALRGARIGVLRKAPWVSSRVELIWNQVNAALHEAGAVVIDLGNPPDITELNSAERIILSYEFKEGINAWFASLGADAPVKSLADLIGFNETHHTEELPFFGQEILVAAQARGPLTNQDYLDALALALRKSRDQGIDAMITKDQLDAIVTLSGGPAWLIDAVNGDQFTGGSSALAAIAGYPSVTVPAGADFGLPIGVSFIGRAWTDAPLLALAEDFETHTHARREPSFAQSVNPK